MQSTVADPQRVENGKDDLLLGNCIMKKIILNIFATAPAYIYECGKTGDIFERFSVRIHIWARHCWSSSSET